jgi:D-alanyl-D-alanine carboxypeptidase/D-alanyl-D-alanine-endopeptidase (penicillin-binding protein 4)
MFMPEMRFNLLTGTAIAVLLLASGTAVAGPPKPLPNPDRPAATPVFVPNGGGAGGGGGGGSSAVTLSATSACQSMRKKVRSGNSRAGLVVKSLDTGRLVCSANPKKQYSLASNTKIFTTATTLGRLGPKHRMLTRVFASGPVDSKGVLRGNLYLRGGGDPSFGTPNFLKAFSGGAGTNINQLAAIVRRAGIKRVTGRVYGDPSVFDGLRGVADSGYATSPWIGPLSGLSVNAGYTSASFSSFSSNPARLAAKLLALRLRKNGISIRSDVALGRTPGVNRRRLVARLASPDMAWMATLTNVNSNNLGAEVRKSGTTRTGAAVVRQYINRSFGARVSPVDGSGLTISNRSSAFDIVKVLSQLRKRGWGRAFFDSLPVAGKSGTLADRMRGSSAQGRCHAKTGTLTGVSALSGYCFGRAGRRYAFSILMNGVYDTYSARAAQDRIAALIARM